MSDWNPRFRRIKRVSHWFGRNFIPSRRRRWRQSVAGLYQAYVSGEAAQSERSNEEDE